MFPRIINIYGAGNVAYHLANRLASEEDVVAVNIINRSVANASIFQSISEKVKFNPICTSPNINIIAVKDDAIQEVSQNIEDKTTLTVHTSGSKSMEILEKAGFISYGVWYPLQSFSILKPLNWDEIPILLTANNIDSLLTLKSLANKISHQILSVTDEQRKAIHIAAVISCNFVNHLYDLSSDWLSSHDLKFDILKPLIQETTDKLKVLSPYDAQTGPARRHDLNIIADHLNSLKNSPKLKEIYTFLSESIISKYPKS